MLEIFLPSKERREIKIKHFKALDGWDIQNKFIEFVATTDRNLRREFTLAVLAYATVISGDREIPLTTDAIIDNHLQTWQNVQKVFDEVLSVNGINPATHAEKPHYWSAAGAEMAVAFIAEAAKLLGPAMHTFNDAVKAN